MSDHDRPPMIESPDAATLDAPAPAPPSPLGPVGEGERIHTLDALRGFALFGIFMVNMQFFAMPFMRGIFDPSLAEAEASEQLAWGFVKVFFEYKFVTLFSLMFGMGLAVQLSRAQRAGRAFGKVYARRLVALALIGLLHAVLLWYGDILLFYAMLGFVLLLCIRASVRTLLTVSAGTFLAGALLMSAFTTLQLVAASMQEERAAAAVESVDPVDAESSIEMAPEEPLDAAPLAEVSKLRGFEAMRQAGFDPNQEVWIDAETAAFKEGPFADAVWFRVIGYAFAIVAGLFGFFWHIIAMFFLGAALLKLDFFSAHRRPWHVRMALICLPIGLAIEGLGAFMNYLGGFDFGWHLLLGAVLHEFGSVSLALGYVGVICLLVSSGTLGLLGRGLACVGRMSLTNYLLQTVIATFIMYWWGLGWFGDVPRTQQVGLVFAIFAGQIVLSALWLRYFTMGPMEWLWRSATYAKFQPIRRSA